MSKKKKEKDSLSRMQQLMGEINKDLPKDEQIMSIEGGALEMPRWSTDIMGLDYILGGGVPKGRIIEIFGPESSGKTTVALHIAAGIHAADPESIVGIVDTEHAMDKVYMQALGIDLSRVIMSQPNSGEVAVNIVLDMARKGVEFILLDSIASTRSEREIQEEIGKDVIGSHAKLMGRFFSRATAPVARSGSVLVCTNQTREKIGVMYGPSTTTPGGNATKFYASIRIETKKSVSKQNQHFEEGSDEITGNKVTFKSIKNKTAPPLRERDFIMLYGVGVDSVTDTIEMAVDLDIIKKGGAWYELPDGQKFQGLKNLSIALKDDADLYLSIKKLVKESI